MSCRSLSLQGNPKSQSLSSIYQLLKMQLGGSFLQILDLASNQICSLEGIAHLPNLRELNLAANPIRSLDFRLVEFTNLSSLNLAATEIISFEALWQISLISSLKEAAFDHPLWGSAPLTQLSNYKSMALILNGNLRTLDLQEVSSVSLLQYPLIHYLSLPEFQVSSARCSTIVLAKSCVSSTF